MKSVRQAGTAPELAVRLALSSRGLRYRLNFRSLPGSPDIANVRRRFAIFVHGCFWHRHQNCPYATTPKTNVPFWAKKFAGNVARDRAKIDALRARSFHVLVLWECQTRDAALLGNILDHFFDESSQGPKSE